MLPKMLRPDSKGRITLGHLAKGISSFKVTETADHKLILEPYAEIPLRERWLFENKKARDALEQGIKEAEAGQLIYRGSFAQFADEDGDKLIK